MSLTKQNKLGSFDFLILVEHQEQALLSVPESTSLVAIPVKIKQRKLPNLCTDLKVKYETEPFKTVKFIYSPI